MQRCSNKVEKEATRTRSGEQDPMELKKSATGPPAAAGGGVTEVEKHAADVAVAAAEEGDTSSEDGKLTRLSQNFVSSEDGKLTQLSQDFVSNEDGKLTRLSQDFVDWILAWKPKPIQDPDEYYSWMTNDELQCFSQEFIDESIEIMRELAELSKRTNARFEEFQNWASAQYNEKGYVEVDDNYIARRVLLRQAMEEEVWDNVVEGLEVEGDNEE